MSGVAGVDFGPLTLADARDIWGWAVQGRRVPAPAKWCDELIEEETVNSLLRTM